MSCRLLYLVGELHTGGSERQLYYLLCTMDRHRYKPAVVVWNYSENDIHLPLIRALDVPVYGVMPTGSRVTLRRQSLFFMQWVELSHSRLPIKTI